VLTGQCEKWYSVAIGNYGEDMQPRFVNSQFRSWL